MQKLNMNHVARKNLTGAKLKKTFTKKLLEICKTITKKSSPDLFNFYVISAGHDMANDAGRATTCRRIFKAPWLQTERIKNEKPTEKMSFNGETGWRLQTKKFKIPLLPWRTKQKNHKTPKAKTKHEPGSHEESKWSKIEKKQSEKKRFELCKTRTKNQVLICSTFLYSRLVLTWPMTLAGLPRAGAIWKLLDYKRNVQKMKSLLKK